MDNITYVQTTLVRCRVSKDEGLKPSETEATCSRCGNVTNSYGTGDGSVKRCLVLMREECPLGQKNFYIENDLCAKPYVENLAPDNCPEITDHPNPVPPTEWEECPF